MFRQLLSLNGIVMYCMISTNKAEFPFWFCVVGFGHLKVQLIYNKLHFLYWSWKFGHLKVWLIYNKLPLLILKLYQK